MIVPLQLVSQTHTQSIQTVSVRINLFFFTTDWWDIYLQINNTNRDNTDGTDYQIHPIKERQESFQDKSVKNAKICINAMLKTMAN